MARESNSRPQGRPLNNPGHNPKPKGNSMPRYQKPPPPPPSKK